MLIKKILLKPYIDNQSDHTIEVLEYGKLDKGMDIAVSTSRKR